MTEVRPVDALDAHVAMIRAFRNPASGKAIEYGAFAEATVGGGMMRMVGDRLDVATTLVVTDRMLDRVLDRMPTIELGQHLTRREMELMPAAYVVFPRVIELPMLEDDDYTDTYPARAFVGFDAGMWIPSHVRPIDHPFEGDLTGVLFGQFLSLDYCETMLSSGLTERVERERLAHGVALQRSWGLKHAPCYFSGFSYDLSWDPAEREEDYVLTPAGEFERRFWLSLWLTLPEEIVAPVHLPRPVARRAARFRADVPEVVVCDLRRVKHRHKIEPTPDGAAVLWSHRWRVRSHLRTLHRGTPEERVVSVRSYVKGPANMPIIEKDQVYRLSR